MAYAGRKLYRSRDGAILGVCRGIADWRDLPVDMVRLVFILLVLLAGMSIWVYFILALIIPPEPEYGRRGSRYRDGGYGDDGYSSRRRKKTAEDVNADFEDLKDRVNRMESEEVDKEKDWDNRFTKGR